MKIFRKERFPNGHRCIYFCGIKIFSYDKKIQDEPCVNLSKLHYKTYNDIAFDIKNNIAKIPSNIDLIVGVPRSGIIPAYMIALALNKQVCSLPEFLSGNFGAHGITRKIDSNKTIKNVLIVDDTCNTGLSINAVKDQLKKSKGKELKDIKNRRLAVF